MRGHERRRTRNSRPVDVRRDGRPRGHARRKRGLRGHARRETVREFQTLVTTKTTRARQQEGRPTGRVWQKKGREGMSDARP